jgi:hypothetical protein
MSRYDDDDYDDRPAARRRRSDDEGEDDRDERRRRRRYQDDEGEYDFGKREASHSGLGIASCALGVLALLAAFLAIGLAADVGFDDIEAAIDAEEPEAILAGLLVLGSGLICLVGGALAVVGLIQRDRNKTFAVIGLGLNALLLLGWLMLVIIGALM